MIVCDIRRNGKTVVPIRIEGYLHGAGIVTGIGLDAFRVQAALSDEVLYLAATGVVPHPGH